MTDLVFAGTDFSDLTAELLRADVESAAILFANEVTTPTGNKRLLVRQVSHVPLEAYQSRSAVAVELSPLFVASVARQARDRNQSLTFVHTHPFTEGLPEFSVIDDKGEQRLAEFLLRRIGPRTHVSLVIGQGGCKARVLGGQDLVRVSQIGPTLQFSSELPDRSMVDARFDRQVRAFGAEGQVRLRGLRVGIVGLGGTGTIVAEQLALLGVEQLLLIDPDVVEYSNLNRLVGATYHDVGKPKAAVVRDYLLQIRPALKTSVVIGSVLQSSVALRLADTDIFFCCTDSHGSRAVLGQFAYQYLVPCIDTGVSITVRDGRVSHITGRVQMLAPGLSCLTCASLLDSNAIRHDLMTDYERQVDPYFVGAHQPQPAVVSLNGTMVSLAVTMFLAAVAHIPAQARYQIYNGILGSVRPIIHAPALNCVVCSRVGALGRGSEWPLPARQS